MTVGFDTAGLGVGVTSASLIVSGTNTYTQFSGSAGGTLTILGDFNNGTSVTVTTVSADVITAFES